MTEDIPQGAYAVIFTSKLGEQHKDYEHAARQLETLAKEQAGFLGMTSARGEDGLGITVSYWESEEAIAAWKRQAEHAAAQTSGRERWYAAYQLAVCKLERWKSFSSAESENHEDQK